MHTPHIRERSKVCSTWMDRRAVRLRVSSKLRGVDLFHLINQKANFYTASLEVLSHLSNTGFKIIKYSVNITKL